MGPKGKNSPLSKEREAASGVVENPEKSETKKLLKEVQKSLEQYLEIRYPVGEKKEEDVEVYLKSILGIPVKPASTASSQEQKSQEQPPSDATETLAKVTRAKNPAKKAIVEKLDAFQGKCGRFLAFKLDADMKAERSFYDVVDEVLVQEQAEGNIVASFKVVMNQSPESEDDFNVFGSVLELMSAFFEAYTNRLDKFRGVELLDCRDVVLALAERIYKCFVGDQVWEYERKYVFSHRLFHTRLLHNLMRLQSIEASKVLFRYQALVKNVLEAKETQMVQPTTSALSDRHKTLTEIQEDLFKLLRTEEFLWKHFGEDDGGAVFVHFTVLNRALLRKGCEAQVAITLAVLGLACDGEKIGHVAMPVRVKEIITKEMMRDGLTSIWSLLRGSNDTATSEAGLVALYNFISFIGEDIYINGAMRNKDILMSLKRESTELINYLTRYMVADHAGFLQYTAGFLMNILVQAIPTQDLLKQVESACRPMLANRIFRCRLMGVKILWTLLTAGPASEEAITRMLAEILGDKAQGVHVFQELVRTLKMLSSTEDAAISRLLGQGMSISPYFKKQLWPWCSDSLEVLDQSFLVSHRGDITQDVSFIADHSSKLLKCTDIILTKGPANCLALSARDGKTITGSLGQAFQQFCKKSEAYWLEPPEKYDIIVEVFKSWQGVYGICNRSDKLNLSMSEDLSKGLKLLSGLRASCHTWEFIFKQIPWLCECLCSISGTSKEQYFASDAEVFNVLKSIQLPDAGTATAIGAEIDTTNIYRATRMTALLHLSRFQHGVSLATTEEFTAEAIKVLESLADTWPTQEAGMSQMQLIADLHERMHVMGDLLQEMTLSNNAFLGDDSSIEMLDGPLGGGMQTKARGASTGSGFIGEEAFGEGSKICG